MVTDKAFLSQTKGIMTSGAAVPVTISTISAGKFRRYMDMALWKQVIRPDIGGKNFVDMFRTAGGVAQSIALLRRIRPDVIFAKGGYVSLPVGYAAHLLKIPLVIHDSDARPGLTNRVLSRWAQAIATGVPVNAHRFNAEITRYTGVPIDTEFHRYSEGERKAAKRRYGLNPEKPLIVVTGGGLGAKDINKALVAIAPRLIDHGYAIYHVTGKGSYDTIKNDALQHDDYMIVPFVYEGLSSLYGAADVVVTRASATALQELAAAAKAAVIVPNSSLGDQIENAKLYMDDGAAVVLRDEELMSEPYELERALATIIDTPGERARLEDTIAQYAKPDAARFVAEMIATAARKGEK